MVIVTAAGIAGVLGRGPYSHRTVVTAGTGLKVDFEPIARSQTTTQVTLHLSNTTTSPTEALFVGSNAVEPMGLKQMLPEPILDRMRSLRMLESDVMVDGRQKGLMRLEEVRYAVIEREGKVSIIPEKRE